MTPTPDLDSLTRQAAAIRASGVLGRSGLTQRLFDYLVECARQGKSPKELDIALDALGRGPEFDVAQDALVRVYIHKLRKKLDEFYAAAGRVKTLASSFRGANTGWAWSAAQPGRGRSVPCRPIRKRAGKVAHVAGPGTGRLAAREPAVAVRTVNSGHRSIRWTPSRSSALWAPLLDDSLPIYVIAGDYYIFGELDEYQNVKRLIRDFNVNSRMDFEQAVQLDATIADKYQDLNLAYLPTSIAFALRDLMPVLAVAGDRVHMVMASDATPDQLKTGHVIYVGYFSGMGSLRQIVFAGSRLSTGSTYDELQDNKTGQRYLSNVGLERGQLKYHDYGYVSSFPGTGGNQIIIVAGTRDIAVMRTAELVTRKASLQAIAEAQPKGAFEALYEVYGFGSTDLDARLLISRRRAIRMRSGATSPPRPDRCYLTALGLTGSSAVITVKSAPVVSGVAAICDHHQRSAGNDHAPQVGAKLLRHLYALQQLGGSD